MRPLCVRVSGWGVIENDCQNIRILLHRRWKFGSIEMKGHTHDTIGGARDNDPGT